MYEEPTEFLINFERSARVLRVPFPELQVLSLDRPLVDTIILLEDFVDPLRCPKNRENTLFPLHGVEEVLASRVPFPELQVLSLDRPVVGTIMLLEDLGNLLRYPKNRQNSGCKGTIFGRYSVLLHILFEDFRDLLKCMRNSLFILNGVEEP
jgi:hypothetical protein